MKMPGKVLYDQVKGILKRVPGSQMLSRIIHNRMRIRELSNLIKENRIAIWKNIRASLAPSILADSKTSAGSWLKYERSSNT